MVVRRNARSRAKFLFPRYLYYDTFETLIIQIVFQKRRTAFDRLASIETLREHNGKRSAATLGESILFVQCLQHL